MFQIEKYYDIFLKMLGVLDQIETDSDGQLAEELEELNAEFEDNLLLMGSVSAEDEDWQEEVEDALCEFEDLAEEYRILGDEKIAEIAGRMAFIADLTRTNMQKNL